MKRQGSMEKRRTGIDRRKNATTVNGNQRTGTDRRVTVKNYYRFIKILEKIPVFNELSVDQLQKILNILAIGLRVLDWLTEWILLQTD